jgi:hypothetical protein
MEAERYPDGSGTLSRWKRNAIPMPQKEKGHLAAAFSPFLVGVDSVLDTFPAGLFFTLAAGFNFWGFDDV